MQEAGLRLQSATFVSPEESFMLLILDGEIRLEHADQKGDVCARALQILKVEAEQESIPHKIAQVDLSMQARRSLS